MIKPNHFQDYQYSMNAPCNPITSDVRSTNDIARLKRRPSALLTNC